MLRSMTGFGAGRAVVGGEEVAVELKSLNHKFCEVKYRLRSGAILHRGSER